MPEENKTRVEEDEIEGAEDVDVALAEETGEATVPDEEALEAVEAEEGAQRIMIDPTEVPQLANLNPGDKIDLITTYNVIRKGDDGVEVEAVNFLPSEEVGAPPEEGLEAPAPAAPPGLPGGGGLPGAGGGLEGLV